MQSKFLVFISTLAWCYNNDFVKQLEYLQKAVNAASMSHDPELPIRLVDIGTKYYDIGFPEIGNNYYLEALKLDGDSIKYSDNTIYEVALTQGDYKKALEHYEKRYLQDSTNASILLNLGYFNSLTGRYKEALKYHKKYVSGLKGNELFKFSSFKLGIAFIGFAYLQNGYKQEADYCFDKILEINKNYLKYTPFFVDYDALASINALRGDRAKAYGNLKSLKQEWGTSITLVTSIKNDPLFKSIRQEPEFQSIVKDMELKCQTEHEKVRKWLEVQGKL